MKELNDFLNEAKNKSFDINDEVKKGVKKDYDLIKKSNLFGSHAVFLYYKDGVITVNGGQEWLVKTRDRFGEGYEWKYSKNFFENVNDFEKAFKKVKGRNYRYYMKRDIVGVEPDEDEYGDIFDDERKTYYYILTPIGEKKK